MSKSKSLARRPGPIALGLLVLLAIVLGSATKEYVHAPRAQASSNDPVIATAGDIACSPNSSHYNGGLGDGSDNCRERYTSDLLVNAGLSAVLPLGDNQYYCGSASAYSTAYDQSWGRVKSITYPAVGNHEYLTSGDSDCTADNAGAAGYFQYFGSRAGQVGQGYYSFDVGSWHLIALNSNCSDAGGCGAGSPQATWLQTDLEAHPNFCTLAFYHIPLFSSGGRANQNTYYLWQLLYAANADLVLTGHDHLYERFAPQTPDGALDTIRGMREFVVGTGGSNPTSFATIQPNSEVRNDQTAGVLKLTLHATSYDWAFVPEAGKTFTDSGTGACHGATPDSTPPSAPTNVSAVATSPSDVNLSWSASTDDVAVVGYNVYRDGTQIGTTSETSYVDTTAHSNTSYTYVVQASDGINVSSGSTPTSVTTPNGPVVLTFSPVADTYIASDVPSSNFGATPSMTIDGSPESNALLKFDVSGLNGKIVASAKLRLYCVNGSSSGGDFHKLSDTSWDETAVTWNQPPGTPDPGVLDSLGSVQSGSWYEVDVTAAVTGDGLVGIEGLSSDLDGARYSTREGSAPPQLILTASDSGVVSDTTAPSVPSGVDATATGVSTIAVSWSPSSDDIGVVGYHVFRAGSASPIATVTGTSFQDSGLDADTSYSYTVSAFDAAGNESAQSSQASAQTDGLDTEAPSVPTGLTATAGSNAVDLSWNASTDDTGVVGYHVYRNGSTSPVAIVTGTSFHDAGLAANATYTYTVAAFDAVPNESAQSNAASATTQPPAADTTAPSVPTGLAATATGPDTVDLSWTASSDDIGVAGYNVYRDGSTTPLVTVTSGTTYTDTGLTGSTAYTYTVSAFDAAGNESAQSSAVTATTLAPSDTTAPSVPTGLAATATGPDTVDLSWTASSDDIGVAGYNVYRDGATTPLATVTSGTTYTDTGLTASTAYTYTVSAFDAAGNESVQSSPVSADTPAATTTTLVPTADAFVNASTPGTHYGSSTQVRVDASPTTTSYLKFDVSGLTGAVANATLRVWANTSQTTGYDVYSVPDTSWDESSITFNTAPSMATAVVGSSGPVSGGTWTTVDVTSLVSGNGTITLGLQTTNSTALSLSSREGSNPPELVITTSVAADTTAPSVPTGLAATATGPDTVDLSWTASSDDIGVAGYNVYRDGSTTPLVTVTSGTTYTDAGLAGSTAYTYTVSAFDAAGNESAQSSAVTATTLAPSDTTAPSVPTGLAATATGPDTVDLSWTASSDDIGVAGYNVYRDGATTPLATVTSGTTYTDTGLTGSTAYTYTVSAFDAAGNESVQSSPVSADTPAATTTTLVPTADAFVNASTPGTHYGSSTQVRVDASPTTTSYLKFDVSGLTGAVANATLRVWANTSQTTGYDVYSVPDTSWDESSITFNTAPSMATAVVGSSGPVSGGTWTTVDVTSLVSGNGTITLGLQTTNSTALSLSSREGSNPPELVITTSVAADTTAPSVPTGLAATATGPDTVDLSWTASSDDIGVAGYNVYRDGATTPLVTVTSGTTYTDAGLTGSTAYTYTVSAFDAAGNESAQSSAVTATTLAPSDTTAPSVPTGLAATATGPDTVDLSWTASSDDIGVAGYNVYRDGATTPLATVTSGTTYTDAGLTGSTAYTYTVSAFDAAGNESVQSSPVSADTPAATTTTLVPTADAFVNASTPGTHYGSSTQVRVDASPTTTSYLKFDVSGLTGAVANATLRVWANTSQTTGYDVYSVPDTSWDESSITFNTAPSMATAVVGSSGPVSGGTWTTVDVTSLVSGNGTITLGLQTTNSTALSLSSREGSNPPELVITTSVAADTTAPSVPTGLAATATGPDTVDLSWTASSDDIGVAGYNVYRDGSTTPLVTVTSGTTYTDAGLTGSTAYTYTVSAFDAAGNESAQSSAVTATTLAPSDTTAPSVPTGLAATATGPDTVDLSWTASSDDIGVAGYNVYRDGATTPLVTVTSGTTYTDTGLTGSTSYTYTVSAFDAAGNESAQSSAVTATTLTPSDTTAPSVPTGLAATATGPDTVDLSWTASTDDIGVAGYNVYRDGATTPLATVTSGTTYTDTGLTAKHGLHVHGVCVRCCRE